jgi:hypothetical protein
VIGATEEKVSRNDPRCNVRIIINSIGSGEPQRVIRPTKPPEFEQVNVYKKICVVGRTTSTYVGSFRKSRVFASPGFSN